MPDLASLRDLAPFVVAQKAHWHVRSASNMDDAMELSPAEDSHRETRG